MSEETLTMLVVFAGGGAVILAVYMFIAPILARRRELLRQKLEDEERPLIREDLLPHNQPTTAVGKFDQKFDKMIVRTGLGIDSPAALALLILGGVASAAGVLLWRGEEDAWMMAPAFAIGVALPALFFYWRQRMWRKALRTQLPDTLFLLARSLRAGRSIEQAFQLIGAQGTPPLSNEFARMSRQLELGLPLHQVVRLLADKLGLVDFNVFASVITLHRNTGGNLPQLLDRLALSTRERNQFEGQFRAATVLGRYSAGFIATLVGVILLYLFFAHHEWAVRFFDTTYGYTGVALFTLAMGFEALGGILLYWMMRHDY
jgi:tight adherence protein B